MSTLTDRRFIAQAAIVLAACMGAWFIFVQPRVIGLQQRQAELAAISTASASPNEMNMEAIGQQAAQIRGRVIEIAAGGSASRDSAGLYRQIMALAGSCGVTVRSLNPGTVTTDSADKSVRIVSIELTARGSYQQMAAFLESLDSLQGYVRPASLTITPFEDGGQQLVEAHVVCEALSFTLPEVLASTAGDDHVHE